MLRKIGFSPLISHIQVQTVRFVDILENIQGITNRALANIVEVFLSTFDIFRGVAPRPAMGRSSLVNAPPFL